MYFYVEVYRNIVYQDRSIEWFKFNDGDLVQKWNWMVYLLIDTMEHSFG